MTWKIGILLQENHFQHLAYQEGQPPAKFCGERHEVTVVKTVEDILVKTTMEDILDCPVASRWTLVRSAS